MHLPDALAEFGILLGLKSLSFNEYGLCRLRFDDSHTVDLETDVDGRSLHLCGVLGPLPTDEAAALTAYQTLLHASFLGEGTGGAYFAIDEGRGELLFIRTLDSRSLDLTSLALAVETFVNYHDGWTRKLSEDSGVGARLDDADEASNLPSMRV